MMKVLLAIAGLLTLLLVRFFCAGNSIHSNHPVKQLKYWGNYQNVPISEKIRKASPEILDFLIKDNISQGWPNRPTAPEVSDDFNQDVQAALKEIPDEIKEKVNQKLTGIILVNDLGGSAFSDYVTDEKGDRVAGFIALDVTALNKSANEWATWKENTPFKKAPGYTLKAEIEDPQNDNRKNAIQYILLHEMGHVFSIGHNEIVPWGVREKNLEPLSRFMFTDLSWEIRENKFTTHFDGKVLDRKGLQYYTSDEKRLEASVSPVIYRQLEMTNFPTLYAATNPFDDFAESFVSYVHSVKMKKPWKVEIFHNDKKIFDFGLCWNEPRCRDKQQLLERILEN